MVTTSEVMDMLLSQGWRLENIGGERAVITNAPSGMELCVGCGEWRNNQEMRAYTGICMDCHVQKAYEISGSDFETRQSRGSKYRPYSEEM